MTEPDPELRRLVAQARVDRFGPGFADRVMRTVSEERAGALVVMPAQFWRVAAAAAVVIALLAGFNVAGRSPDDSQSVLEALFGLEPVTASSVYETNWTDVIEGTEL